MAVIIQRTFVEGAEKGLAIAQEEFVRKLTIGNTWSTIRVSLLLGLNYNIATDLTNCQLMVGLCSGTTNPFGAVTTTNFVGANLITRSGGVGSMTYQAGAGNPYIYGTLGIAATTKVGAVVANNTISSSSYYIPIAGVGTARRSFVGVYITKGSPNYTAGCCFQAANVDCTLATWYDAVDQPVAVPTASALSLANGTFALAASEAPGIFDTVNVFWNRMYPLEIYAVGVTRIA